MAAPNTVTQCAAHVDGERLGGLLQQLTLDDHSRHTDPLRQLPLTKTTLGAAALLATGSVLFVLGQRHDARPRMETVAATPASKHVPQPAAVLEATGFVVARRQATVSTQITGTITEVLMEEGKSVVAGQVLTRLENAAQSAALSEAAAQVRVSHSVLSLYEAQLLERKKKLAKAGAASTQAMEMAMTQVDTLRSQIESQHRQVALAEAQVASARVQLNLTIVRAPFSGVVVAKAAQPGEIVSPTSAGGGLTRTGIGTIVDMQFNGISEGSRVVRLPPMKVSDVARVDVTNH